MSDLIRQQAVHWLVRHSGEMSPADRAAFRAWRADPHHDAVYRDVEARSDAFTALADHPAIAAVLAPPTWRERLADWMPRPIVLAGAAVCAALIAVVTVQQLDTGLETDVAEIRHVRLDDGSMVTIGADSHIDVLFTDQRRQVTLLRGDAFFEVAKDPSRPFIVDAGATQAKAIGTQFDVHRGADEVRVAVLEGVVEVTTPTPEKPQVHTLSAGQQVTAPRVNAKLVRASAAAEPGAWRTGRLVYNGSALREVVADINRYYPGRIQLASGDLGDLRVTASFQVSQVDDMVDALTLALPLQAQAGAGGKVVLKPR